MNAIKNKVKRYSLNTNGRDFVIGDLHGKYSVLRRLLDFVNFDKTKDRLFSVGDLVDRGEDSMKCLQLIYEPWFHTCIGNHEDMLIEAHSGNENAMDTLVANGGSWSFREDAQLVKTVSQDLLERGALIMVVDTPLGRRNIVHAELMRNADRKEPSDDDIDNWNFEDVNEVAMQWGRTIQENKYRSVDWEPPKNLSITYCGHTVVNKPHEIINHRFIDTGAAFARYKGVNTDYCLTMVNLMTEETFQANQWEEPISLGNPWKTNIYSPKKRT